MLQCMLWYGSGMCSDMLRKMLKQRLEIVVNKMPRDKKAIHRATSDVEDEDISDEEEQATKEIISSVEDSNLIEERKKQLKSIILKRTLALKQQRERDRQQRVNSTQK